jgi:hypothetical protein
MQLVTNTVSFAIIYFLVAYLFFATIRFRLILQFNNNVLHEIQDQEPYRSDARGPTATAGQCDPRVCAPHCTDKEALPQGTVTCAFGSAECPQGNLRIALRATLGRWGGGPSVRGAAHAIPQLIAPAALASATAAGRRPPPRLIDLFQMKIHTFALSCA